MISPIVFGMEHFLGGSSSEVVPVSHGKASHQTGVQITPLSYYRNDLMLANTTAI